MDFHVLSTHGRNADDTSPLQLISAEQLAHYQAMERAVLAFLAALGSVGPLPESPP